MDILLISGHGAGDPGATATIDGAKYEEAIEARVITQKVKMELSKYANVTLYPTDRNAYGDYKNGVLRSTANFGKYDYVLEIHFNACVNDTRGNGKTTGTECYVTTSESGVSVETAILNNIAKLGFKNRGVKKQNFAVINTAKNAGVSSALLEVCFIDDADDMRLYINKRDAIAKAIVDGVVSGFGLAKVESIPDYASLVCNKAGLGDVTKTYLNQYKYASDLWKKLWEAMS